MEYKLNFVIRMYTFKYKLFDVVIKITFLKEEEHIQLLEN